MKQKLIIIVFLISIGLSCRSHQVEDPDDPLKNSKKLMAKGHKSLYYNGAFAVKGTSIKLIPPFSESEVFIYGQRVGFAKQAFSDNLKKAAESVYILKQGSEISLKMGEKVSKQGQQLSKYVYEHGTKRGVYIIKKSLASSYGIIGSSFDAGMATHRQVVAESEDLRKEMNRWAETMEKSDFPSAERPKFSQRAEKYKRIFREGFDDFVLGYTNLDVYLAKTLEDSHDELSSGGLERALNSIHDFMGDSNSAITDELAEVVFSYGQDVGKEFGRAGNELAGVSDGAGLSFALFKAMARVTKGILFDATIKPLIRLGAVSVGYVTLNAVIYPVALVSVAGVSVAKVMLEVVKVGTKGTLYIIAPNARLALAGIIGSGKFLAVESYNAADASAKTTADSGLFVAGKGVRTGGFIIEKAGTYILAPLSLAGVTIGKNLYGGGVAISGTTGGVALSTGSGSVQAVSYVGAKTAQGGIVATGTAASLGVSIGYGAYQVGKAIGIPTGVTLKSGIVMNYEMASQLSAHTILAVSDFSYLVLSLEGGKWVVYAVKDSSGRAKTLLTGAVVDLQQIRKGGDEIVKVPVSEQEMEKILDKSKQQKKEQ